VPKELSASAPSSVSSAIDLGNPHDVLAGAHIRTITTGGMKIETLG